MEVAPRVAVVGCGWAGSRHARALIEAGARLCWAVDTDPGRARAVACLGPDARPTVSLEEALAGGVDVVDVCLPHALHADVCIAASEAGKDVLCEKPLAVTLEQADRMTEAAERAGTLLMVAENECFSPVNVRVGDLLEGGAIGRPAVVQASRECDLRESFRRERRWFLDPDQAGGGILMAGAVHDFAKLRMLLGEVAEVHALRARQRFEEMGGEDTVVLTIRFASGVVGTLVESFFMLGPLTAGGDEVHRLRIDGDAGSIEVAADGRVRVTTDGGTDLLEVPSPNTFDLEVRHFLDCVRSRAEPLTSARRQRGSLAAVRAAYLSMELKAPVRLSQL